MLDGQFKMFLAQNFDLEFQNFRGVLLLKRISLIIYDMYEEIFLILTDLAGPDITEIMWTKRFQEIW